jgi:hypothetical protein
VADKLGVTPRDLSDPVAMETVRLEKGLGTLAFTSSVHPDEPGMIEAKFNIAELLDIPINCVERFKRRASRRLVPRRSARRRYGCDSPRDHSFSGILVPHHPVGFRERETVVHGSLVSPCV